MSRVRIVTDSTADIPSSLAAQLDIAVVPCHIYFGDEAYRDGLDLTSWALFERMAKSPVLPRTTQPPVSYFVDTYQQLLDGRQDDTVLSIHVASSLSGTVNAAWAAAQMLGDPARVEVIDTGQLSMATGWAVVKAAQAARGGASIAEVSRGVRALLPRLRVAAMIDTLENLRRGGRISQVAAVLGTALQIKPLLSIQEGRVWVWERVRTQAKALVRLTAHIREWGPLVEMAVLHTGAEDLARALAGMLEDLVPAARVLVCPAGAAITTHLGLGAVGVCAVAE